MQGAVGAQALAHFMTLRAGNQRHMLGKKQVVGVRTVDATDFIDVSKSLCDQQRRIGTVAFKKGIDDDCGSMQKQVSVAQINARTVQRVLNALMQLAVSGQRLTERYLSTRFIKTGHVSESASDIHCDTQ